MDLPTVHYSSITFFVSMAICLTHLQHDIRHHWWKIPRFLSGCSQLSFKDTFGSFTPQCQNLRVESLIFCLEHVCLVYIQVAGNWKGLEDRVIVGCACVQDGDSSWMSQLSCMHCIWSIQRKPEFTMLFHILHCDTRHNMGNSRLYSAVCFIGCLNYFPISCVRNTCLSVP